MARHASEETGAVGHDSFLDIVTNMVGILIVLVLVVGLRIKNAPATAEPSEEIRAAAEALHKDEVGEQPLRQDVAQTMQQLEAVAQEAALRGQERDLLATAVAALEHQLRQRRDGLDAGARDDFDLRRGLSEVRAKMEDLQRRRAAVDSGPGETVVVQSYPTPLAKNVTGEEAHFQLRGGRIAFIPLEPLLLTARSDARTKADKLVEGRTLPELTATVGPEGGFRLRYSAERHDEVERTPQGVVRHVGLRFTRWQVIPVGSRLGEPVEAALAPDSQFRRVLANLRPETTITIWVSEDSFASFRALRKDLYQRKLPVAARPLPLNVMIGASLDGSRSEAE
jgi:hypothetical protein